MFIVWMTFQYVTVINNFGTTSELLLYVSIELKVLSVRTLWEFRTDLELFEFLVIGHVD